MNNIFEGAKFGDKYINRAGKILIFQKIWDGYANLFSENSVWSCPLDGKNGEVENEFDIIGKYQEQIDKDKLDQKKIDIDKACEWLKNELYTYHNEVDKRYPNDVKSASYFTAEELIDGFKKAMEE